MLLIGSRAARFHFPDARKPKDYDFIATSQEVDQFLSKFDYVDTSTHEKKRRARINLDGLRISFEFDIAERVPSSNLIYKYDWGFSKDDNLLKCHYRVASPQTLFLLKRSHIIFNIHWQKNIYDYLFLRERVMKMALPLWWEKVYQLRLEEVKNRVSQKGMNFDVDNSDFFKKSEKFVNRIVEHDSLHYATCFYDKPLFLVAKDDLRKAALSENKVQAMSHDLKIKMIQEECMALSLERYIIPSLLKKESYDSKLVYQKTACKMVYNYLPLWFRHFAADNFLEILDLKIDYVTKCLTNHLSLKQKIMELS